MTAQGMQYLQRMVLEIRSGIPMMYMEELHQ